MRAPVSAPPRFIGKGEGRGTNRLAGGNPVESYTSDDVTGLAKVFTGYEFDLAGLADQADGLRAQLLTQTLQL